MLCIVLRKIATKFSVFYCVTVMWTLLLISEYAECLLESDTPPVNGHRYKVEGTVSVPYTNDQSWFSNTRIMIDGGHHLAFIRY